MKEMIKKIKTLLKKGANKNKQKTKAQSMVEFAVTLPILIALLIGMVEFGFMLNTYLSLLDATRNAARQYSNSNPTIINNTVVPPTKIYNEAFDDLVSQAVIDNLNPPSDPGARKFPMDPTLDDILVSVISVDVNTLTNPDTISSITRITTDSGIPVPFTSRYGNFAALGGTHYDNQKITDSMTLNGVPPVSAGLLIVELYYSYEGTLNISTKFMTLFGQGNHIMLYTSTIMPLVAVRPPPPTPTP